LGSAIRAQLVIGPVALARLHDLNFVRASKGLSALCQALALGQTDDWSIDYVNARIEEIGGTPELDNDVKVMLLASELIKLFGEDILASALAIGGDSFRTTPTQPAAGTTLEPRHTAREETPSMAANAARPLADAAVQAGGQVVPLATSANVALETPGYVVPTDTTPSEAQPGGDVVTLIPPSRGEDSS
jgi:hypothetical protein